MADKYFRILLNRKVDSRLIKWLESERKPGERPNQAITRKLYRIYDRSRTGKGE